MSSAIGQIILGVVLFMIGISNMKGNISTLHWYHRQRVTEEDRLPFGRMVGLGTVIIGVSIMICGGLSIAAELTQNDIYTKIGSAVIVAGLVPGLILNFGAMIKYNKGIF